MGGLSLSQNAGNVSFTAPAGVPCISLAGRHGQSCDGRSCQQIISCPDGCALEWQQPSQVRKLLQGRYRWMLFVGDSDLRLMVLFLFQVLAQGGYGEAAVTNRGLWLGRSGNATQPDDWASPGATWDWNWSRRCMLDWFYEADGTVRATRSVQCVVGSTKLGYVEFGKHYNLSLPKVPHALRVTYIGTSGMAHTLKTMQSLTAHLANEVAPHSRPDALILSSVAFVTAQDDFQQGAKDFVASAQHLAAFGSPRGGDSAGIPELVFATSPSHRETDRQSNARPKMVVPKFWVDLKPRTTKKQAAVVRNSNYNEAILPRLPPEWHVLDRDTELNRLVDREGSRGIRLSSGHLPHLNNFYDLQRLVHGLARSETGGERAPATCIRHQPVNFSGACAGYVSGDSASAGENRFIEIVHHFCHLEL